MHVKRDTRKVIACPNWVWGPAGLPLGSLVMRFLFLTGHIPTVIRAGKLCWPVVGRKRQGGGREALLHEAVTPRGTTLTLLITLPTIIEKMLSVPEFATMETHLLRL